MNIAPFRWRLLCSRSRTLRREHDSAPVPKEQLGPMAASPEQSTDSTAETRAMRHRTARFIGVFVVSVLVLLTAYRYSMNAPVNDWYLFHVAGHTAWALDKIGDRAELENQLRNAEDPRRVRADLEAWKQTGATATAEAVEAAPGDPLTAWERFQHRLQKTRRENPTASVGPRVQFIWRYGVEDESPGLRRVRRPFGTTPSNWRPWRRASPRCRRRWPAPAATPERSRRTGG
ncbi:MAG: hypothetical protein HC888_08000 [Candidatus Competibacteraceae bacterium]|nr:hypothetical protein [Candidatus Competibacteraceae bacterium]